MNKSKGGEYNMETLLWCLLSVYVGNCLTFFVRVCIIESFKDTD